MAFENSATRAAETSGASIDDPGGGEAFSSAAVGDRPAAEDLLGFDRYVETLEEFLTHPNTKPPLTVSIEGAWGAGKSTFMTLLRERLEEEGYLTVQFNPWRHETEDALWAAFMISFLHQVSHHPRRLARLVGHLKLIWYRLDPRKETTTVTLRVAAILVALLTFPVALWFYGPDALSTMLDLNPDQATDASSILASIVVLGGTYLLKSDVVGRTESKLREVLTDPEYEDRVSFVEEVHTDLGYVLDAYVGPAPGRDGSVEGRDDDRASQFVRRVVVSVAAFPGALIRGLSRLLGHTPDDRVGNRVFVFIDDLDRCEVPKSAELMQAINLLLATDDRMVFLLGLDREKVAAGVAVKNEASLKYLAPETTRGVESYGLTFGYDYLEKFIQIPFRVPRPSGKNVAEFTDELLRDEESSTNDLSEAEVRAVVEGWNRNRVTQIVLWIAPSLEYNPRSIKRLLNLFRLRAYIAATATPKVLGDDSTEGRITLPQLGKFVALSLEWPRLYSIIAANPTLLVDQHEAALREELRNRWRSTAGSDATTADAARPPADLPATRTETGWSEDVLVDASDVSAARISSLLRLLRLGVAAYVGPVLRSGRQRVKGLSASVSAKTGPATASDTGSMGPFADHLSERDLRQVNDLLLAGLYDNTSSDFEELEDEELAADLARRFDEPDFTTLEEMTGGVEAQIERLSVHDLERFTGANREYSLATVDIEIVLRISPPLPVTSEPPEVELPSGGDLARAGWWLRKTFFTQERAPDPYFVVDASPQEVEAALGRQGFEESWETSYSYRGEILNMANRVHDIESEPPYRWWQTHVQGYTAHDGMLELQAHWEPDPIAHREAYVEQIARDVPRGMDVLRSALEAEGIEYRDVEQVGAGWEPVNDPEDLVS